VPAGRQGSHKRVRGEMDGRESPSKELRSQRHLVTKSDWFPRLPPWRWLAAWDAP
jgi:hypothetical protein